jgi:hypothetical protein
MHRRGQRGETPQRSLEAAQILLICDRRAQGYQPFALLRNGLNHQLAVVGSESEAHSVKDVSRVQVDRKRVDD